MGTHCATVAFGLICFLAPNYGFSLTSNYEAKILALLMALVFLIHPYARTFFMQPKSCCDKKNSNKSNKNTFRKRYPWVELTAPTLCIITCFAASNHWAGLPLVQTLCQAGGAISLAVLFYAIASKLYQTYQYNQQKAAEESEAKEEHKGGASAKSAKEKIQRPIY